MFEVGGRHPRLPCPRFASFCFFGRSRAHVRSCTSIVSRSRSQRAFTALRIPAGRPEQTRHRAWAIRRRPEAPHRGRVRRGLLKKTSIYRTSQRVRPKDDSLVPPRRYPQSDKRIPRIRRSIPSPMQPRERSCTPCDSILLLQGGPPGIITHASQPAPAAISVRPDGCENRR